MGIWSSIFKGLGRALKGRSARKQADKEADRKREDQQRSDEMLYAQQRRNLEAERRYSLEDRRYKEEAVAPYRGMGTPGLTSPAFSSTEPTPVGAPRPVALPPGTEEDENRPRGLAFWE